jgi:hypothetical protein
VVTRASTVDGEVLWLNGPFGVGKTSVAAELARRRPMITFDPEIIGSMLWRLLPGGIAAVPA